MGTDAINPKKYIYAKEDQSLLCIKPSKALNDEFIAPPFSHDMSSACVILNDNFTIANHCSIDKPGNNSKIGSYCQSLSGSITSQPFHFLFGQDRSSIKTRHFLAEYFSYKTLEFSSIFAEGATFLLIGTASSLLDSLITE